MKTGTTLIVDIFERFCCFDEVLLMALTSAEEVFIERPLYRCFLHNITYPISSNLCKKFICNVIGFTIFHLAQVATGGVLLEKYSGRKTPEAKSLFNKVAG